MRCDRHLVVTRATAIARGLGSCAIAVIVCACAPRDAEVSLPLADVLAAAGEPLPLADIDQIERFERGREVFARRFEIDAGLGPLVNATSCAACHEKPVLGGTASRYRNVFVVADGGPGNAVAGRRQFTVDDRARAPDEPGTTTVARNPLPLFGVGLLAEIPDEEILLRHDPNDADGDGISGRVNFERGFVGRFGYKAQIATLQGFVRAAAKDHIGLTSVGVDELDLLVEDGPFEVPTADEDDATDPELAPAELADLLAFVSLLAGPAPGEPSALALRGRERFEDFACAACHVPALVGPRGPIPAFTDLLLHDMGAASADGVEVGEATSAEFRTPPLWGVDASGPFLHDGRADTLDAAIRAHGGEAEAAKDAWVAASPSDREAVLALLSSLSGHAARTDGLLPIGATAPAVGEPGGPLAALGAAEQAEFERGRLIFDRDVGIEGGLGPRFNGDSCRSCHFDDAVGGAGPADVDVIRHGILDGDVFEEPQGGTMAHRHDTTWSRPAVDPRANVFERRQTPTILGLGLVDAIPEASILSLADPDDVDGDGISGRAHVLPDGRVGRLGWKADVPTLAEFARDAYSNELGLTVPAADSSFGRVVDHDAVMDPELDPADLEDVVRFMARLGPPPRRSLDAGEELRGESVFVQIGCAECHVPALTTDGGAPVRLYSDLLLHDVADGTTTAVPQGAALAEFRTAPLWGLGVSAPYLHDGRAPTIAAAIELHDGEALASRMRFSELASDARSDLLAFLQSL